MANKQSIQDVDAALDRWHRTLTRAVKKIDELRKKRKGLITGKIKHPPPQGKVVKFGGQADIGHEDIGDLVPSFGPR